MKEKFADAIRAQIKIRSMEITNKIKDVDDEQEKLKIFNDFIERKKIDEDELKRQEREKYARNFDITMLLDGFGCQETKKLTGTLNKDISFLKAVNDNKVANSN